MKLSQIERHELKTELEREHGLTYSQLQRLRGETEAELRADALELASELAKARRASNTAPQAPQQPGECAW